MCGNHMNTVDISQSLFPQLNIITILYSHLTYLNLRNQCQRWHKCKNSLFSELRQSHTDVLQTENCFVFMNYFCYFFKAGGVVKKKIMQRNEIHKQTPHTVLRIIVHRVSALLNVCSQNTRREIS